MRVQKFQGRSHVFAQLGTVTSFKKIYHHFFIMSSALTQSPQHFVSPVSQSVPERKSPAKQKGGQNAPHITSEVFVCVSLMNESSLPALIAAMSDLLKSRVSSRVRRPRKEPNYSDFADEEIAAPPPAPTRPRRARSPTLAATTGHGIRLEHLKLPPAGFVPSFPGSFPRHDF